MENGFYYAVLQGLRVARRGGYMVMMRHMFDTTTTQQMIDHHLRTGCESHLGRVNGCWVEVDFLGNYLMTSKAM